MNNELVSVIIPVWNAKHFLMDSIKNILHQSYSPLEIIYVDDGSMDGSAQLLDECAKLYPIRVVHKNHGGGVQLQQEILE